MENLQKFRKEEFDELENLLHLIDEQKQTINEMNDEIVVLESEISHSEVMMPNSSNGLCLRINGIELPPDGQMETNEDCS